MHGQQLRQLEDTLVTLSLMCWQLVYQAVSAYHLINRHSGKVWVGSHQEKTVVPGLVIKIEMDYYFESNRGMALTVKDWSLQKEVNNCLKGCW